MTVSVSFMDTVYRIFYWFLLNSRFYEILNLYILPDDQIGLDWLDVIFYKIYNSFEKKSISLNIFYFAIFLNMPCVITFVIRKSLSFMLSGVKK